MRIILASLLAAGAIALSVDSASAAPVTCTTFAGPGTTTNGSESFPGTFVGAVGTGTGDVCQIGDLSTYNGGSGGAFVNLTTDPSIYEIFWGGGLFSLTEQIGNNGTTGHPGVDVDLYALASQTSTSPGTLLSSTPIPFSSGKSSVYSLYDADLSAGYYAIDTFLAVGNVVDPNFQINFLTAPVASVPEPASIALLGAPLLAFGMMRRKRRSR